MKIFQIEIKHVYADDLASKGLQKCYAPKFTSTISLQLIQMVVGAKLLVEICLI